MLLSMTKTYVVVAFIPDNAAVKYLGWLSGDIVACYLVLSAFV